MKKVLIPVFGALLMVFAISSCKPEKKTLGPAASQTEGLTKSTWVLYKVAQIDVNQQLAFVESDTLLDVSDVYIDGTPVEATFTDSGNYSLTVGAGTTLFPKLNGKWSFDNAEYPTKIVFDAGTAEEAGVALLKPIRPQDANLVLKFNKICGGKRTVSYHLWFTRK